MTIFRRIGYSFKITFMLVCVSYLISVLPFKGVSLGVALQDQNYLSVYIISGFVLLKKNTNV